MPAAEIVLLTRVPEPGRVKTRLEPALGPDGAAALHALMVEAVVGAVSATGLPMRFQVDGDLGHPFVAGLARKGPVEAQGPGDLGERLVRAVCRPGRQIAIGTDSPVLDPSWLLTAARAETPVQIGPAEDGGYWCIGVDGEHPGLFARIPWSTAEVLGSTLQRAQGLGLAVQMLPTCYDIDLPPDLQRLVCDPRCPPPLRAFLEPRCR